MRKLTFIVMALAMVLGFTQCKKEQLLEPQGGQVGIILDVNNGNNNGSRAEVVPPSVNFETGDQILVASNGHYVGTLTYNGTNFSGNITNPVENEPLYFYFLGNNAVLGAANGNGDITSCTVDISDQTYYPHLPVISMGVSINRANGNAVVNYSSGVTSYEAQLHNKASLIKFNVITDSDSPICITGMNNQVTVNFADRSENDGFSYGKADANGVIKMKGESGSPAVKWAIVLQQDPLDQGANGTAYTEDGAYVGARAAVPAITMNQYLNQDRAMTVNTVAWDGDLAKITNSSTEAFATARDGMTIYGTLGVKKKVSIADGATVTLNGISINSDEAWANGGFAGLTCLGDATIIIADGTTNVVRGIDRAYPAIHVPSSKTLTIQGATGKTGKLFAYTNGHQAAGIGGGNSLNCGNIVIESGNVTAKGSDYAAAIGGGNNASCGYITISTGVSNVTAINVDDGPCIGAGEDGTCGTITIGGNTTGTISTRYYTYPETAMHLFDIEGSLIYYIPGNSWEEAAAYEENAFYIFNDEKVMINIDNEEKRLKCDDEDVAPDATINPNASYSWATNAGGDLTSLNIEGVEIWYSVGETWDYAIYNHDNLGWEINGDEVFYNGQPLLDGLDDPIHSWEDIGLEPDVYHFGGGPDK